MSALVPNRFKWLKPTLLTSINALYAYGCQSRRMLIKRGDRNFLTLTQSNHVKAAFLHVSVPESMNTIEDLQSKTGLTFEDVHA